jgi:hypothetical protein
LSINALRRIIYNLQIIIAATADKRLRRPPAAKRKKMARHYGGSMNIENATRINLKDIRRTMLVEGAKFSGTATTGKGRFLIDTDWTGAEPFIRLRYSTADGTYYDYTINVLLKRSNLGRGVVMYFVCPESGTLCRTLYMAYNYPRFKARTAYRIRLYYADQLTGGRSRYNDLYWKIENALEAAYKERRYFTYKGKDTRRAKRIKALEKRSEELDFLRWTAGLPAVAARLMA